jgi:hypothetical protein
MSRNRVIYSNEALLVGPSPATGVHSTGNIKRIHRVQTIGNNVEVPLESIYEYGRSSPTDRVNLNGIMAKQDFSYLAVDFENEKNLGFTIDSTKSAIADFLNKSQEDRNYFRFVAPEGYDADGLAPASGAVLAIGNGFIANYSFEVAVGSFPMATLSVEGLNASSHLDGVGEPIPAVDPSTGRKASGTFTLPTIPTPNASKPTVIRPGDVKVNFSNSDAGVFQSLDAENINVQSASINFGFNLSETKALGTRLSKSKEITFPIDVNVSIESLFTDLVEANLVDLLCEGAVTDVTIDLYNDDCDSSGPVLNDLYAKIIVRNARFLGSDLSSSIGPNDMVKMNFVGQVTAANDVSNGVSFSGVYGYSGTTPLYSN